jgi:hypothetical protein
MFNHQQEDKKDLAGILNREIEDLRWESGKHRLQFRICQTLIILFSAASSVISGWALKQSDPSKDAYFAILIITAITAAISGWVEMKRSRDLWQHERPLYHALKDLRRELIFLESIGEGTVEKKKELFDHMQTVLGQAGKKWTQLLKEKQPVQHTEPQPPATDRTGKEAE